jgi:two-component system KDP operon response regulator KdpE
MPEMKAIKILGVDDEPQMRKLLRVGLGGYGYQIITAASGEEALTVAARQAPDLIILELDLEGQPGGIDVCRALREWSKTPVIALSWRTQTEVAGFTSPQF